MSGSWILQTTYSKFQKMPNSHLMLVCQTAFNVTKLETCKPANTLCYLPIPLWTYRHRKRDTKTYSSTLTHSQWKDREKKEDHLSYVIQYNFSSIQNSTPLPTHHPNDNTAPGEPIWIQWLHLTFQLLSCPGIEADTMARKYFWFCRPHSLYHNHSTLLLQCKAAIDSTEMNDYISVYTKTLLKIYN